MGVAYGFFCGGDPRTFFPDDECCSADEVERHRLACKLWDEAEARGETPTPEACPSGWVKVGAATVHVLRSGYGIGTYSYDDGPEPPDDGDEMDWPDGDQAGG